VDVTGSRTGDYRTRLDVVTPMDGLVFNVARGWGMVDGTRDGVAFRFVNTHTEAWDRTVRDAQRDELLRLTQDAGQALFVVGDFNAEPDAVGVPAPYQDAWVAAGAAGDGHTCGQAPDLANPVSQLRRRIDYVWVRNARVTGCRVVGDQPADRTAGPRLWPSDHACVVADVRF
jgi:endonuclease/exonuclease/phosphatase family metal-dependent hydrolase